MTKILNFLCSIFNKGTKPFDFIKRDIIRKLADKVKHKVKLMEFDHVFQKFQNNIFLNYLARWCEHLGKNQYNNKEQNQRLKGYENFHII